MADIGFDGRVAIITGAGGGLGRAHALELARRGARIVVNDLGGSVNGDGGDVGPAQAVVQEILDLGGEAVADTNSVATYSGGAAVVQTAVDAFGTVDVLVNNAGILRDKSFHNLDQAMIDAVIQVHLLGAFYVTQPAYRIMREKGYGRIVNTSSTSGLLGNFGQTNYGAAKAGVAGFTRCLALEGKKYNIRVWGLVPVAVTRMTEDLPGMGQLKDRLDPGLVSPVVLYMVSELSGDRSGLFLFAGGGRVAEMRVIQHTGVDLGAGLTAAKIKEHEKDVFMDLPPPRGPLG